MTSDISDKHMAHLSMIQGVINRMTYNSFALKAFAATIAAVMITITGTQQSVTSSTSYAGFLPVIVFWFMDAKYLRLERLYRKLYDHIRKGKEFEAFSMSTTQFDDDVLSTLRIAVSWSVIWFYLTITAAMIVVLWLPTIIDLFHNNDISAIMFPNICGSI